MQNLSLSQQSHHSVMVNRLVLHRKGPGFKSRLRRFFHWEYKLQCKIFDITILFVILFLFFFKAVPTQSQPSIHPFFDIILFYFLTKLPTMVGSKSLNLFKMERKFSKFAQMGLNLSNSIHTCPNWSKLVQIGLN